MTRLFNIRKFFSNSFGQTLLEIVILLGVLLIVTSGVVIISVNSLRNSQFSKNQTQATRLAQEGIDKVRTGIRKNCPILNLDAQTYYWYENTPLVWGVSINNVSLPRNYTINLESSPCQFTEVSTGDADNLASDFGNLFKRQILISDDTPNLTKKVTSLVEWTDFSGKHSSNIVTIISKNNL